MRAMMYMDQYESYRQGRLLLTKVMFYSRTNTGPFLKVKIGGDRQTGCGKMWVRETSDR